jgi:peroxiredoxin
MTSTISQNLVRESDPDIKALFDKYPNVPLKVGDTYPDTILSRRVSAFDPTENKNKEKIETFSTHGELQGRRVVLFIVPGAWTPTCTGTHLAGFVKNADKILALGVSKIFCATPDKVDPSYRWNEKEGDPSKISMWSYDRAKDIFSLGLALDMSLNNRGQGLGFQRAAMIIDNCKVVWIQIETSAANCNLSHADNVVKFLEEQEKTRKDEKEIKKQKI